MGAAYVFSPCLAAAPFHFCGSPPHIQQQGALCSVHSACVILRNHTGKSFGTGALTPSAADDNWFSVAGAGCSLASFALKEVIATADNERRVISGGILLTRGLWEKRDIA